MRASAGQRRNFFVLPYEGGKIPTPMTNVHKNYRADYAVVGSGIAGLRAAIELSAAGSVLVLAKSNLSDSATRSEERRVGKECRYRWWREHRRKKEYSM